MVICLSSGVMITWTMSKQRGPFDTFLKNHSFWKLSASLRELDVSNFDFDHSDFDDENDGTVMLLLFMSGCFLMMMMLMMIMMMIMRWHSYASLFL